MLDINALPAGDNLKDRHRARMQSAVIPHLFPMDNCFVATPTTCVLIYFAGSLVCFKGHPADWEAYDQGVCLSAVRR